MRAINMLSLSRGRSLVASVLIGAHERFCDPRLICPMRFVAWTAWLLALWMVMAHDGP